MANNDISPSFPISTPVTSLRDSLLAIDPGTTDPGYKSNSSRGILQAWSVTDFSHTTADMSAFSPIHKQYHFNTPLQIFPPVHLYTNSIISTHHCRYVYLFTYTLTVLFPSPIYIHALLVSCQQFPLSQRRHIVWFQTHSLFSYLVIYLST